MNFRKCILLGLIVVFNIQTHNRLVENARLVLNIPQNILEFLDTPEIVCKSYVVRSDQHVSLFDAYPHLRENIPHITCADLPTPIMKAGELAMQLGIKELYIKRDDLTGKMKNGRRLFGGNKVRKLEFLLADALERTQCNQEPSVMTFGCVGSNHAVATAVYARECGLEPIIMLKPQYNSAIVHRNLLLHAAYDSHLHYAPSSLLREFDAVATLFGYKQQFNTIPYVIPTGGSNPVGILGYVNAAFELKEQIQTGQASTPDLIYVPLGSAGTVVGLLLGIKAADIKTHLVAVAVEPEDNPGEFEQKIQRLFTETNALLCKHDSTFPQCSYDDRDITIVLDQAGEGYALGTTQAKEAIVLFKQSADITLDCVYTGKAAAGLVADAQSGKLEDQTVLFWNTFCADDFSDITNFVRRDQLLPCLEQFFVQEIPEINKN